VTVVCLPGVSLKLSVLSELVVLFHSEVKEAVKYLSKGSFPHVLGGGVDLLKVSVSTFTLYRII